ncbi:hypothetical protein V412_19035 [Escherichia coli LAU-EC7]|nr:hypothetical protein V412_19035 [Escherichia coli LAU-EC7]
MHAWGIDGHQLTVEITESMMMEHDTEIFKRIQILRDMGIGLSVDDFGTGFSGLSRLVSLPVTEIKIDKSFVDRCLTEKRILALLEAITSIGQSLNLTVVAEGVETKEQFEMLRPRFYVSTSKSIIKALINMHSFEIQLSPIG